MSSPWEVANYAEMEARLAAARQLRRDELLAWLVDAVRRAIRAMVTPRPRGDGGAYHPAA